MHKCIIDNKTIKCYIVNVTSYIPVSYTHLQAVYILDESGLDGTVQREPRAYISGHTGRMSKGAEGHGQIRQGFKGNKAVCLAGIRKSFQPEKRRCLFSVFMVCRDRRREVEEKKRLIKKMGFSKRIFFKNSREPAKGCRVVGITGTGRGTGAVSYTHLDVYKRQDLGSAADSQHRLSGVHGKLQEG